MNDKPNALRLADEMDNGDDLDLNGEWWPLVKEATAELRRLYESNQRLITALREATLDMARHTPEYFQDERDLKDCIAGYLEIAEKEEALLSESLR